MKYQIGLSAENVADFNHDRFNGVGMIRGEYLCRLIEEYYTLESCRNYIYSYLEEVCKSFEGKEVWYRNADFIVEEVNVLKGADHIVNENISILGLRGTRRGLKYKDVFRLELEIVAELSQKYKNLNILFSYIKDVSELDECIDLIKKLGFENKYGVMAEIPSVIIDLDNFLERNISNITIGVNDLTTLILGTYRGSQYHNCNHPTILSCISECVKKTRKKSVTVSVAGIVNKELLDNCERIGVDNFVVNYSLLNEVLDISTQDLPDLNLLMEIKQKTKKKRVQEKIEWCKTYIKDNEIERK